MNSKVYTDFNDLHVVCGLEEVSKQINSAISSLQFSPEPPINEAHNFHGQTLDEMESNAVCEGVQGVFRRKMMHLLKISRNLKLMRFYCKVI